MHLHGESHSVGARFLNTLGDKTETFPQVSLSGTQVQIRIHSSTPSPPLCLLPSSVSHTADELQPTPSPFNLLIHPARLLAASPICFKTIRPVFTIATAALNMPPCDDRGAVAAAAPLHAAARHSADYLISSWGLVDRRSRLRRRLRREYSFRELQL